MTSAPSGNPRLDELSRRIERCLGSDRARLRRRLRGVRQARKSGKPIDQALARIRQSIEASERLRRQRAELVPAIHYPDDLPISARAGEIGEAIREHPVVVVCGETGSGKSTQLPKICLELGRGIDGTIAHTQPRRIAARSVAARLAEETGLGLGGGIGYKVRFTDRTKAQTLVKTMTDGMLLAETQGDPLLRRYDTIIVDEAHERSLNIDFLLGILTRTLRRRDDLRVVITSATIDPERFSAHFDSAPIIEVSGRTFPVEVRYRPLEAGEDEGDVERDEIRGVVEAVDELVAEGPGDILAFFPGEREIRQAAEALRKRQPAQTEILPLYARLSGEEQQRIFAPHSGRRIVLATNVAETSLTVPGIRYVVDTGLARISRFSHRSRVQRLEIEPISRASAEQRTGRCGRIGPGVCVRLYAEDDFERREAFTPPEILRSNLAGVILQMKALELGGVEDFPFVEKPDPRMVREGYKTLHELGAVDEANKLTGLGREMSKLPIDPRIARIVLAGAEHGCLDRALILAGALSVADPRERPHERAEEADAAHARFVDPESDFLTLLNLWEEYRAQAERLSRRKLARWCRESFLSLLRLREWGDVRRQLAELASSQGLARGGEAPDAEAIHRALLTGFLSSVGRKAEGHEYEGPHGVRFHLFPGSALFDAKPQWVMAAELVRTTRLYARTVAAIRPEWIESAASHLVRRTYHEPFWERRRGRVNAYEKVSLHGLEVIPRRKVHYGPINPDFCRETFIFRALVEGEYRTSAPFVRHNADVIQRVEQMEARLRRRDLLTSRQRRFEFYDRRVPRDVYQGSSFERWRRWAERRDPELLYMTIDDVLEHEPDGQLDRFPERVEIGGAELPVDYRFEPGQRDDGATLTVPVEVFGRMDAGRADWAVPGLVREKVVELVRRLPKDYRRVVGPAKEFADEFLASNPPRDVRLTRSIAEHVAATTGTTIPDDVWTRASLPSHLDVRFRVVDETGEPIAEGRDLSTLRAELADRLGVAAGFVADDRFHRDDVRAWDFGDLPESLELRRGGVRLTVHPALLDRDGGVLLRALDDPDRAASEHRRGVVRLFTITQRDELDRLIGGMPGLEQMTLLVGALDKPPAVRDALARLIADHVLTAAGRPVPRSASAYAALVESAWNAYAPACREVAETVVRALELHQRLALELDRSLPPAWHEPAADIRAHLHALMRGGRIFQEAEWERIRSLPRYLRGIERRIERLKTGGLDRDARSRAALAPVQALLDRLRDVRGPESPAAIRLGWRLEELRISLFAEDLGTREPVSPERLTRELDAALAE